MEQDFQPRNTGINAFLFKSIPEPLGIMAPIRKHPLCFGQVVERGLCADVIADWGRVRQCSLIAFVKLPCISATRLMVLFEVGTGPPQHGVGWVEPANVVFAVIG